MEAAEEAGATVTLLPPGFLVYNQPATRFPGPLHLHLTIFAEDVAPPLVLWFLVNRTAAQ